MFDSHPSYRDRYPAVFCFSNFCTIVVEMAEERDVCFVVWGSGFDDNEILCDLYYEVVELYSFWNIVSRRVGVSSIIAIFLV